MSVSCYCVRENGNITFYKEDPFSCRQKPFDPAEAPTKKECLEFLEYLRGKENCTVLHRPVWTLFHEFDLYDARVRTLKEAIKKPLTAAEACVRYAKQKGVGCVNRQVRASLGADIWYGEDFYEFLISIGCEKEKALFFTGLVCSGDYKSYSKSKKNENLSCFSQTLHEFALAAAFPRRKTLFEEFSYEYALFSRIKEKELINGINDKSERIRKNTLRLIENDGVRNRLDDERHEFDSGEAAVIVHNCSWLTLEEKHEEWKNIIADIPDTSVDASGFLSEGVAGVHSLLSEMIAAEDGFLAKFKSEKRGTVYTVERLKNPEKETSSFQTELMGVFLSLPSFYETYKSMSEPNELTAGFIVKRFSPDVSQEYESVYMNSVLDILRIGEVCAPDTRVKIFEHDINIMQHNYPEFS